MMPQGRCRCLIASLCVSAARPGSPFGAANRCSQRKLLSCNTYTPCKEGQAGFQIRGCYIFLFTCLISGSIIKTSGCKYPNHHELVVHQSASSAFNVIRPCSSKSMQEARRKAPYGGGWKTISWNKRGGTASMVIHRAGVSSKMVAFEAMLPEAPLNKLSTIETFLSLARWFVRRLSICLPKTKVQKSLHRYLMTSKVSPSRGLSFVSLVKGIHQEA